MMPSGWNADEREALCRAVLGRRPSGEEDAELRGALRAIAWAERSLGVRFPVPGSAPRAETPHPVEDRLTEELHQTMRAIQLVLPDLFGKDFDEVFSRTREQDLVQLRFFCFEALALLVRCPVSRIAREFGYSHTTIIHARRALRDWMDTDRPLRDNFNLFLRQVEETRLTTT